MLFTLFINFFPNLVKFIYVRLHSLRNKIHCAIFISLHRYYSVFDKDIEVMPYGLIIHIHRLS